MYFDFTDDQKDLAAGAREFFQGECTPAAIRQAWDDETGHSADRWKKLADTGFIGITVPEAHGGLGMDAVDLVLLLEEAGAHVLPEPLLETTAIAVPTLLETAPQELQAEWLPRIAAGEAVVTVQLGREPVAVAAHVADLLVCERDGALHAVPADRFTTRPQPSLDGARRVFAVDAQVGDDTLLTTDPDAIARAFDRGAAGTAALLNGIARHLVAVSTAYVKEREQFGRPVGSFQAVKHLLAETLLEVETARAAGWYAAYAVAHDLPDRAEAVSVAKSFSTDAEALANTNSLQAHGGIGFTWEHDLHLWLKRGKALEGTYGTASWHRRRLAEQIFA